MRRRGAGQELAGSTGIPLETCERINACACVNARSVQWCNWLLAGESERNRFSAR